MTPVAGAFPEYRFSTLEEIYEAHCGRKTAMAAHLPRLRALASGYGLVAEFGVKRGASTVALLLAAQHVISVDLVSLPGVTVPLAALAGDRWTFIQQHTHEVDLPPCELLLVDADHTYASVKGELERHADKVRRTLVFHDTITFGSFGAEGETGQHRWTHHPGRSVPIEALGIRPAIDELMIRDRSWRIAAHYTDSHGLLVLERA